MKYLKGERVVLIEQIKKEMKTAAKNQDYELAAHLRNQLFALQELSRQILFSDREQQDISKDHALVEIAQLLNLDKPPRRIEGFDISHTQGTNNVASMVVFINGAPDKSSYRKFKMRLGGNDDFAHLEETLTRRLREENIRKWGIPDLILIDGGKGQLQSAIAARTKCGYDIPMIGLAKKEEEIIIHKSGSIPGKDIDSTARISKSLNAYTKDSGLFFSLILPQQSNIVKLLQRIRDESHRFAVSYHSTLRIRSQTASLLDNIPGVGPTTRKKLIRKFGSARGVAAADKSELAELLGIKKAEVVYSFLKPVEERNV
jgi:excinuclease ABC subunit C